MSFATYGALQDEIAEWLNRSDLDDAIPEFIRNAESALRDDPRVRRHRSQTFTVDSEEETLPDEFVELDALYLDGDNTEFGRIEIVPAGSLSEDHLATGGSENTPQRAAIIDGRTIRFAPAPDESFDFEMVYWETVPHLSDTNVTNWLLQDRQDIYLYASLMEAAPYLRDDQRVPVWKATLKDRLDGLRLDNWRQQYGGGSLVRRTRNPIP